MRKLNKSDKQNVLKKDIAPDADAVSMLTERFEELRRTYKSPFDSGLLKKMSEAFNNSQRPFDTSNLLRNPVVETLIETTNDLKKLHERNYKEIKEELSEIKDKYIKDLQNKIKSAICISIFSGIATLSIWKIIEWFYINL